MGTRHTPGPWEAVEHSAKSYPLLGGVPVRIVKQGGRTQEDTICEIIAQGDGRYESEVTAANAHLIAAAPELYKALKSAAHYMVNCGLDLEVHYPDIVSALDKAEGRTA